MRRDAVEQLIEGAVMRSRTLREALAEASGLPVDVAAATARDSRAPRLRRFASASRVLRPGVPSDIVIALVRDLLQDDDMILRRVAVCACGDLVIRDPVILGTLWATAQSSDANRLYALRSLAQHRDERVVAECVSLFSRGDPNDRRDAAMVLGFLGTADASAALRGFLDLTNSNALRVQIAISLCRCGDFACSSILESQLRRTRRWRWVPLFGWYKKWEGILIAGALAIAGSPLGRAEVHRIRSRGSKKEKAVLNQWARAFVGRLSIDNGTLPVDSNA